MIQRFQSLFFMLAGLFFGGQFIFPLAKSNMAASGYLSDQIFNSSDHIMFLILASLGVLLSLAAIFLYKNRPLQIKISYLLIVLSLLIVAVAVLVFINYSKELSPEIQISDQIGAYFPIGSIIFAVLAGRFVKKDEKLVRSMDRLR